jgi:hypothetical protein
MHWTSPCGIPVRKKGEPVSEYGKKLCTKEAIKLYAERLKSLLIKGIRFGKIVEEHWFNENREMPVDEICFTEMRLTESSKETEEIDSKGKKRTNSINDRYGYLGIGLHRKYVVKNHGNPVFYVENNELSNLVSNAYYIKDNTNDAEISARIDKIISYMKMMGINRKDHYYKNYDDMEWRIALDNETKKRIDNKIDGRLPNVKRRKDSKYYLTLELQCETCVECIVFPHEKVLNDCIEELAGDQFFDDFKHSNMPILTTINRIRHL